MTDKQIIGGRGSAKSYTTLNTIEVMLENEKLKEALKAKEQECEDLRKDIKDIANLLDLDTGEEYNFSNIESAIKNYCADCDVAERMRKVTYAATGGRLSYANYTVEAIEQAYNDQLRIDVEYRTKELEQQLDQLKAENDELKKIIERLDVPKHEVIDMDIALENEKLKQTLTEIKEICNKTVCDYLQCSLNYNHSKDFECEKTSCNRAKRRKFILQILQKISEVEDDQSNT